MAESTAAFGFVFRSNETFLIIWSLQGLFKGINITLLGHLIIVSIFDYLFQDHCILWQLLLDSKFVHFNRRDDIALVKIYVIVGAVVRRIIGHQALSIDFVFCPRNYGVIWIITLLVELFVFVKRILGFFILIVHRFYFGLGHLTDQTSLVKVDELLQDLVKLSKSVDILLHQLVILLVILERFLVPFFTHIAL